MVDKKDDDFNFDEDFNFDDDLNFDDDSLEKKPNVENNEPLNQSNSSVDSSDNFDDDPGYSNSNTDQDNSNDYNEAVIDNKEKSGMMTYLIAGVVGIVIIYGGYKYISSNKETSVGVTQSPIDEHKPLAMQQHLETSSLASSINDTKNEIQSVDKSFKSKADTILNEINNLNKKLSELTIMQRDMAKMQGQINDISSKVVQIEKNTNIKKNLNNIFSSVDSLLLALKQINLKINEQRDVLTSFVKSNIGDIVSPNSNKAGLKLEAIIPGRAWLKTKYGVEQTVALGDYIPGYGKVVQIDAQKGMLVTDTGNILRQ